MYLNAGSPARTWLRRSPPQWPTSQIGYSDTPGGPDNSQVSAPLPHPRLPSLTGVAVSSISRSFALEPTSDSPVGAPSRLGVQSSGELIAASSRAQGVTLAGKRRGMLQRHDMRICRCTESGTVCGYVIRGPQCTR